LREVARAQVLIQPSAGAFFALSGVVCIERQRTKL
jgi:hypothetical protein